MQVIKHVFFWQMTPCQTLAWRGSMNRTSSLSLSLLHEMHEYIIGSWFIPTERWGGQAQRPSLGKTVMCKTQMKFPPSFWLCLLLSRSWNKPGMVLWNCNWARNILPAACSYGVPGHDLAVNSSSLQFTLGDPFQGKSCPAEVSRAGLGAPCPQQSLVWHFHCSLHSSLGERNNTGQGCFC